MNRFVLCVWVHVLLLILVRLIHRKIKKLYMKLDWTNLRLSVKVLSHSLFVLKDFIFLYYRNPDLGVCNIIHLWRQHLIQKGCACISWTVGFQTVFVVFLICSLPSKEYFLSNVRFWKFLFNFFTFLKIFYMFL